MELGTIDLDTRFEYMIIYKKKNEGTINTWTLGPVAFKRNYLSMKNDSNIEILGVYKDIFSNQWIDIINELSKR